MYLPNQSKRSFEISGRTWASHVLDRVTSVTGTGEKLYSLVAGCYMAEEQFEKYAGQSNQAWWRGICVLKDVKKGFPYGGEQFITVSELKKLYDAK